MPLAYLILAHRNPAQVARLFKALHHPEDTFVLHFDRRAPAELHTLGRELAAAHPANVFMLPSRSILWGGGVMSEVQIEAMGAALEASAAWRHFINLTGQDFPLRSRAAILARLEASPDANYIGWHDPLASGLWKNARERIEHYHLEWPWLHRLLAVPGLGRRLRAVLGWTNRIPYVPGYRRRWPDFFRYYGGANHVVLTREACHHLLKSPHARRIRRWLLPAAHANEIVFPSVLLNSPLAHTVINDHLRAVEFPNPASPNPRTFTSADLPRLLASPALYARKFDDKVDAAVLDALQAHIQTSV